MERLSHNTIPDRLVLSNGIRQREEQAVTSFGGNMSYQNDMSSPLLNEAVGNTSHEVETINNSVLQAKSHASEPHHTYYPALNQFQLRQNGLDYARRKKPSGRKQERRKVKLPNQIRHDENASIAVGTWKKRSKKQTEKIKPTTQ